MPNHKPPDKMPDDEFVRELTRIDESVAESERLLCGSPGSVDEALSAVSVASDGLSIELEEAADCLLLINRVRSTQPASLADLADDGSAGVLWLDGGEEHPSSIGRFEVKRRLGQGGFGIVFLAHDPELDRNIALKVPRIEALITEQTRQRFLREGKAAASLNHANIAAVYEAGRIGPICYIASAHCAGGSLSQLLKDAGTNGPDDDEYRAIATLIATLADAVQHAHNRGILHRDLKPGNILFEQPVAGITGELSANARIVDFGLARTIESSDDNTRTGATIGTPSYMSPEQATGQRDGTGPQTDVYSLGAILYELICGRPPFKEASDVDTLVAVRTKPAVPVRKRRTECPTDLAAVCMRCLEKDPTRRYGSASELSDDLNRFLEGRSVFARSTSNTEQLVRWCRRNPTIAGLISTTVLLLVILVIGTTTASILLARSNRDAVESRKEAQKNLADSIEAEQRASRNERLANEALYESRIAQARLLSATTQVGRRLDSLAALSAAADQIEALGYGEYQKLLVRNEAIKVLSLVDLVADTKHQFSAGWPDRNAQHYAHQEAESIEVSRTDDDTSIATLPGQSSPYALRDVVFSPDGTHLAATFGTSRSGYVEIWRWRDEERVFRSAIVNWTAPQFDFLNDGSAVIAKPYGSIAILNAEHFDVRKTIPADGTVVTLKPSPDSKQLAVHRGDRIEVLDIASGKSQSVIEGISLTHEIDWSSNGELIGAATGTDGVVIWNATTGEEVSRLRLKGKLASLDFHPSLDLAATRSYDGQSRIWDLRTEKVVVVVPGVSRGFSDDGRWLSLDTGRYELIPSAEHRVLRQPLADGANQSNVETLGFLENGRLLVASDLYQLVVWDLATNEPLLVWKTSACQFDPTGKFIVGDSEGKLARWPVVRDETEQQVTFRIGEPQSTQAVAPEFMSFTPDGNIVAYARRYRAPFGVMAFDFRTDELSVLTPHHKEAKWIDISPDGQTVVTGTWHGSNVRMWDRAEPNVNKAISSASARVKLNPAGTQFAVDTRTRYSIIDVETAKPIHPWTRRTISRAAGPIAFTSDGQTLAITDSSTCIKLMDVETWTELARFEVPAADYLNSLAFTPDGTKLIAGTEVDSRCIHVWDIALIRKHLQSSKLDWSRSQLPLLKSDHTLPISFLQQTE